MPLIDRSYFVGEIVIARKDTLPYSESLDRLIAKYEDEQMCALLGWQLTKLIMAEFATGPGLTTPRYLRLVNGTEYTDKRGVPQKWMGLRNITSKQSLLANHVYYWFMRRESSTTTPVGETEAKSENSVKQSPGEKMARAWSEMNMWIADMYTFLDSEIAQWPELAQTRRPKLGNVNVFGI